MSWVHNATFCRVSLCQEQSSSETLKTDFNFLSSSITDTETKYNLTYWHLYRKLWDGDKTGGGNSEQEWAVSSILFTKFEKINYLTLTP